MHVVVPFGPTEPNTRLSPVLDATERRAFADAMCRDVLDALAHLPDGVDVELLATEPVDADVPVTVDERPLTAAVNDRLTATDGPVAVVMADLALVTPRALERLLAPDADVVLAPGRGGGTNAVVARHPDFRVDYHGASVRDHRRSAHDLGASLAEVDSFRLATDVDEPADLVEVLLHTDGRARDWLDEAGFELAATDGRVTVERD